MADLIAIHADQIDAYENHQLTFDRLDNWLRHNTVRIEMESQ
jgi:hypothetical protein